MTEKSTKPLATLKNAFKEPSDAEGADPSDWTTFTSKMPTWESDLTDLDKSTLDSKLVLCGLDGLRTPAMATALVAYFKETSPKKRGRDDDSSMFTTLPDEDPFVMFVTMLKDCKITDEGVINPPHGTVFPSLNSIPSIGTGILVRKAYEDLLSLMLKDATLKTLMITGTPGVGKSALRMYLLWAWLNGKLPKFTAVDCDTEADSDESILIRKVDATIQYLVHQRRRFGAHQVTHTLGLYELGARDNGQQCVKVPFVVFTASGGAKEANGNGFDKREWYEARVLPLWSEPEFLSLGTLDKARFEKYGGVPRLVLELSAEKAQTYVALAIKALTSQFIGGISQPKENLRPKQRILELGMDGDPVDFISKHVWLLMLRAQQHTILNDAKKLCQMLKGIGFSKSLTGVMFETYFHMKFGSGDETLTFNTQTFSCTSISEISNVELNSPVVGTHDQRNVLFVPFAQNCATFDSYFITATTSTVSLVFLQLTVGSEHKAGDCRHLEELITFLHKSEAKFEVLLLYVVPKHSTMTSAPTIVGKVTAYAGANVKVAVVKTSFDL